ncbi:MAG: hypothetical protein DWQ36_22505 [Acidobacteria bacterium]|nr:MAG: hypothetical protein DWQ30_13765 [Acidobacteriota bacterium]REK00534.1 MAG: hypothetical protein DWQ36_22505 [Acidobacteriota bacterium]
MKHALASMPVLLAGALLLAASQQPAAAQRIVDLEIDDNVVTARLVLPLGLAAADLTIRFEEVVGLSESSLGLSLSRIGVLNPRLLARLPELGGLAGGLPMLLTISPPASGGLSFSGVVEVELYTRNLHYTQGSPLRLLKATGLGDFYDITDFMGSGSYRVRGTSGGFSVFLIGVEGRSPSAVIEDKYGALHDLLDDHADSIPAAVATTLQNHLDASELGGYGTGDLDLAIDELDDFIDVVEDNAGGTGIPNVWRSSQDLVNVAGELVAAARTLRFSLGLAP